MAWFFHRPKIKKYWSCFLTLAFVFGVDDNNIYDKSWALVVGINDYNNVPNLNYAVEDALASNELQRGLQDFINYANLLEQIRQTADEMFTQRTEIELLQSDDPEFNAVEIQTLPRKTLHQSTSPCKINRTSAWKVSGDEK